MREVLSTRRHWQVVKRRWRRAFTAAAMLRSLEKLVGFLGVFVQHFLIYNGADNGAYPFPVAMMLVAVFDLFILWLILRWSGNGAGWDDRHRVALVNGALSLLLVLGSLLVGNQYPVMYCSNPIFLLLLWLAARKVGQRVAGEQSLLN